MSRYEIVTRLAGGAWEACEHMDDEEARHKTLATARKSLQEFLVDVRQAFEMGSMDEDYSAADYAIRDVVADELYNVAWNKDVDTLQIQASFREVLAKIAACLDHGTAGMTDHHVDLAKTVSDYGVEAHWETIGVVMPSADGAKWNKFALAPTGWTNECAADFVNKLIRELNQEDRLERGDVPVGELLDARMKEAGFVLVDKSVGNMAETICWDCEHEDEVEESAAPAPGA